MRVEAHELFKRFMSGLGARPRGSVVHSLAASPSLGEFLADLDPGLKLDWSGQSFLGLPSLREKVIARSGLEARLTPENVLITAGTAEANFLVISQLIRPGDEMIVDVPGWPQPLVLGPACGAKVKPLRRREELGWRFDMAELEALITPKTRLIFICNPNNPTGQYMTAAEVGQVVNLASRVGAYVLCDEVYSHLEWEDRPFVRMAAEYERGISTGSVSKVLGLQGLRTGWLITPDPKLLFDAMVLREDTSEIMNIMGEAIADIALKPDRFATAIARARIKACQHLDLIDDFISRTPGLSWQRPAAGLIGFVRIDVAVTSDILADTLLTEPYSTFVMPGSAYGYPQHLRLGAGGNDTEGLSRGLEALGQALAVLSA